MKVAILTLRFHSNFGFIMQAYALQSIIRQLGHEPYTYDTRIEVPSLYIQFKQLIKNILLKVQGKYAGSVLWRYPSREVRKILDYNTNAFITEHIQLTDYCKSINDIENYDNTQFGAFVVGSDQVWREEFSLNIPTYFFDFVKHKAKKISYAASFGTTKLDYTTKSKEICKRLINKFDLVTVRESDGVDICRENFNVDAIQVLDPTMLLSKEKYYELADRGDIINKGKDFIYMYVLSMTDEIREFTSRLSREKDLAIINLQPKDYVKNRHAKINECTYPSMYTLLRAFRDARYVVTDSFHGTVFSILFNTQFYVFGNSYRGNSRLNTLLKTFGLQNRFVDYNTYCKDSEFTDVEKILREKRALSLDILNKVFNE